MLYLVVVIDIIIIILSGYLLGDRDTCFMVISVGEFHGLLYHVINKIAKAEASVG
jgi:hypothetical protein